MSDTIKDENSHKEAKPQIWHVLVGAFVGMAVGIGLGAALWLPKASKLAATSEELESTQAALKSAKELAASAKSTVTELRSELSQLVIASDEIESSEPLSLGESVSFTEVSVTAYQFDLDSAADGPQPDSPSDKWASVEVEACATGETLSVSSSPWSLVSSDNRHFTASHVGYGTFPEPDYAFGEELVPQGTCRRGWITFTVNKEADITALRYLNDQGQLATWELQ